MLFWLQLDMADTREFSMMKILAQICAIETFEKAAALAFFKIPRS